MNLPLNRAVDDLQPQFYTSGHGVQLDKGEHSYNAFDCGSESLALAGGDGQGSFAYPLSPCREGLARYCVRQARVGS